MAKNTEPINFVSFNALILGYWGMWPIAKGNSFCSSFAHWSHTSLVLIIMLTLVFGQLLDAYDIIGDVIAISENSTLMFTTLSMVCKAFNVIFKRKKLIALIALMQCNEFLPKNEKQATMIQARINMARTTAKCFFLISVFTLISFLLFPLFDGAGRLPCPVNYPYVDINVTLVYVLIYLSQVISLSGLAIINSSMDTLMPGFMSQAIAQLECLNNSLNNLIDDHNKTGNNIDTSIQNFKNVIVHHRTILQYIKEIEDMFDVAVFFQYLVSGVVICCSGIQLVIINPKTQPMKLVALGSYLATMLSEIFMFCWFGNEIMAKSELLIESIYNMNWMDCTPQFKKIMLFFMERVKIPIIVTVGKMFKLNLNSFSSILNTSYSYFALLRHIYGAEDDV